MTTMIESTGGVKVKVVTSAGTGNLKAGGSGLIAIPYYTGGDIGGNVVMVGLRRTSISKVRDIAGRRKVLDISGIPIKKAEEAAQEGARWGLPVYWEVPQNLTHIKSGRFDGLMSILDIVPNGLVGLLPDPDWLREAIPELAVGWDKVGVRVGRVVDSDTLNTLAEIGWGNPSRFITNTIDVINQAIG